MSKKYFIFLLLFFLVSCINSNCAQAQDFAHKYRDTPYTVLHNEASIVKHKSYGGGVDFPKNEFVIKPPPLSNIPELKYQSSANSTQDLTMQNRVSEFYKKDQRNLSKGIGTESKPITDLPRCYESKTRYELASSGEYSLYALAVDFLFYSPIDRTQKDQAAAWTRRAIPYEPIPLSKAPAEHRAPLSLASFIGVRCLPTHVYLYQNNGKRYYVFKEGLNAWEQTFSNY